MTQILTRSLIPIFVCLLFGYAAGSMKVVNNENPKELVTFLMSFALPCTLFVTIARTSAETLRTHANIAAIFGLVYIVTFLATYCVARFFQKDTADESAVVALTLGFPNLAGVGLPLLAALYGAGANVSVVVGLDVGAVTITPIPSRFSKAAPRQAEIDCTWKSSGLQFGGRSKSPCSGCRWRAWSWCF